MKPEEVSPLNKAHYQGNQNGVLAILCSVAFYSTYSVKVQLASYIIFSYLGSI